MNKLDELMWEWGVRCFGLAHMTNRGVRALRFFEEAIELCQAVGLSKKQLQHAIDVVYSRPRGSVNQEIGGVRVTLGVLTKGIGEDLDELFYNEVSRCLSKSPDHFAKRNAEKLALGLDAEVYPKGGEFKTFGPDSDAYD